MDCAKKVKPLPSRTLILLMWNFLLDSRAIQMKLPTLSTMLVLAFFLAPARAYSCTCEIFGDGSPGSTKHHAKAVFIGALLEGNKIGRSDRRDRLDRLRPEFTSRRKILGLRHGETIEHLLYPHSKAGRRRERPSRSSSQKPLLQDFGS